MLKLSENWKWLGAGIIGLLVLGVVVFSAFEYVEEQANIVAVIPVNGFISIYDRDILGPNKDIASSEEIVKQIEDANRRKDVKTIIIEVNSPGGTIVATREIVRAIKESKKPTVAWIREVGTSGGYWVAAAADYVVADEASLTGSIGVIGSYLQFSELMKKHGITYERLVSGEYKDLGSPFKELTEEERALIQSKINALNELFVKDISILRNLPLSKVRNLATGEIFLGKEALKRGLVDELGGLQEAQKKAEELAGIRESEIEKYKTEESLLERLLSSTSNGFYLIGKGIGDSLANQNQRLMLVVK